MINKKIVFDNIIKSGWIERSTLHRRIPSGVLEHTTSSDNRDLLYRVININPTVNQYSTSVVLLLREQHVKRQSERHLLFGSKRVESLRPSDNINRWDRVERQWIVESISATELRGGGIGRGRLSYNDWRWVRTGEILVPVDSKVGLYGVDEFRCGFLINHQIGLLWIAQRDDGEEDEEDCG